ncbi:GNAT family N-acetyltransferase [Dehalogenimonas sp. THU2]|uniref:GNAT family N-acetyltransferase n=1 Tax=Dehalogenimonas sp. THU2 TaxID=3151121 RepID=UPI0032188330
MVSDSITYEEGFRPGYLGRMVQILAEGYEKIWHSGTVFEVCMAREMCDFHDIYTTGRDAIFTAHTDGTLVGGLAVLGDQKERPGANLRWFIVEEEHRRKGIGRELLSRAIDFCREHDFQSIHLWIVEGLDAARRLYESSGFVEIERAVDRRFTVERKSILMELDLSPPFKKGD